MHCVFDPMVHFWEENFVKTEKGTVPFATEGGQFLLGPLIPRGVIRPSAVGPRSQKGRVTNGPTAPVREVQSIGFLIRCLCFLLP